MEQIRPSSDLRNHYSEVSRVCRDTREPMYITVNGREDTIIMNSVAFRQMKARLELLDMLAESEEDIREGRVAPIKETFDEIRGVLETRRST